ncbi:MAG TPA: Asp23/Gls24 family envelope stress response protein [Rubrobacteraceae bacterium]|nr:Asp23/Gls24 family envelope stress response protein [Rubrobacteraceae bacterium]
MTERTGLQRLDSPLESERGSTTIGDSVVSRIAGIAVGEVEGVRMGGSASRAAGGILESVTGSASQRRGVSVEVGRVEAAIDLTMGVEYGRNILELVGRVRDRITQRVESLTGLQITELNVTVSDIIFPDEKGDGRETRRERERGGSDSEDQPQPQQAEEPRTGDWGGVPEYGGPLYEGETHELQGGDEGIDETRPLPRLDETRRERRQED